MRKRAVMLMFVAMLCILYISITPVIAQEGTPSYGWKWAGPDSVFYGFKIAFQNFDERFTFNDTDRLNKQLAHADERMAEARAMLQEGKQDAFGRAMEHYQIKMEHTNKTVIECNCTEQGLEHAREMMTKHQAVLMTLIEKSDIPDTARPALWRAFNNSICAEYRFEERMWLTHRFAYWISLTSDQPRLDVGQNTKISAQLMQIPPFRRKMRGTFGEEFNVSNISINFTVRGDCELFNDTSNGTSVISYTNTDGKANVTLNCTGPGFCVVTATSPNVTWPGRTWVIQGIERLWTGYRISLTADPRRIEVSENSTIYAQLRNRSGIVKEAGVNITFTVIRGDCELFNDTSNDTSVISHTDTNGTANVTLHCTGPGFCVITATSPNVTWPGRTWVIQRTEPPWTGYRISLTADPSRINVSESSTIYAQLRNRSDIVEEESINITFTVIRGDCELIGNTTVLTNESGIAEIMLNCTGPGICMVKATSVGIRSGIVWVNQVSSDQKGWREFTRLPSKMMNKNGTDETSIKKRFH